MNEYWILGCVFAIPCIIYIICKIIEYKKLLEYRNAKKSLDLKVKEILENSLEMTPNDLFMMAKRYGKSLKEKNVPGVYVIHNITKDMYYVGQGKRVIDRLKSHFHGRGNGDVYADYKYGDEITIKIIILEGSEFESLNSLESYMIKKFYAYSKGYNKTRGNSTR